MICAGCENVISDPERADYIGQPGQADLPDHEATWHPVHLNERCYASAEKKLNAGEAVPTTVDFQTAALRWLLLEACRDKGRARVRKGVMNTAYHMSLNADESPKTAARASDDARSWFDEFMPPHQP